MSSFTTPLIVTPLDNGRDWKLFQPFEYHVGKLNSGEVISVPEGFVTDFASIPRIFWIILPPWGKYGKAAVIHDFIYKYCVYNRKRCDQIFYEGMKVLKVPYWKRMIMYKAVRWFAGSVYKNYRNAICKK